MSFKVTGRITVLETGIPIPTLKVQVWDRDLVFDDDLGEVITDASGWFEHTFERADFDDFGLEAYPDLYLIVTTADDRELIDTSPKTRYNASENEHFELRVPVDRILEEDGALYWAIRPRVVGELSVRDGDQVLPSYIGTVADAFEGLVVELWDPVNRVMLAADEPTALQFSLWYWIGDHPRVRELEVRVRRGSDGRELYRSRRFGVSLDTQRHDVPLQKRVILGVEEPQAFFSHTSVAEGARITREPSEVISTEPTPMRKAVPPSASSLSPFASPALPTPVDDDATEDGDIQEEAPEPFRMILPPRPEPVAKVGPAEE